FSVIDLDKKIKLLDVKAGRGTEGISVTPDGKEIWVGNNDSRSIMVFDAASFEKLSEIKTDGIPIRVEISPDGKTAAVSEPDTNSVSIYDVEKRQKVTEIDVSQAGGKTPVTLLFSPDGTVLWAATTQAARVIEISTTDWTITRSFSAGRGSDGLGYSKSSSSK
ncbi:MAG: beta-propeller fold lactonase family protein, partial [Gammaproteobacteria bacterium]|nr:beta-propeller fold lactonase family protein [Gammaproteobacteria bacterium]